MIIEMNVWKSKYTQEKILAPLNWLPKKEFSHSWDLIDTIKIDGSKPMPIDFQCPNNGTLPC